MFLADVAQGGPIQALEAMVHFSGARQRLINHNIANLTTPGFRPVDVEPASFQRMLGEAIDARRQRLGGATESGPLELEGSDQIDVRNGLRLRPQPQEESFDFEQRNKQNLERHMQDLSENLAMFRLAGDLLRSRISMMREVLADRV